MIFFYNWAIPIWSTPHLIPLKSVFSWLFDFLCAVFSWLVKKFKSKSVWNAQNETWQSQGVPMKCKYLIFTLIDPWAFTFSFPKVLWDCLHPLFQPSRNSWSREIEKIFCPYYCCLFLSSMFFSSTKMMKCPISRIEAKVFSK